ncbi:MAG: glycosyltransferase [Petrimonas sp.]|nr:glycosyltransferase [Petrimonas sp.]
MNILHINYTDLIGSRFNGYYMQQALEGTEYDVNMAVWRKEGSNPKVFQIPPSNKLHRQIINSFMFLGARLGLDRLIGLGGYFMTKYDFFKQADIIHIHIIHNFSNLSILSLPRISKLKPTVWTIHDPWALTGGCEHSFDCNRWLNGCNPKCPYPRSKSLFMRYMPFVHWRIKKKVFKNSNLSLIVASEWMENKISKSPLLNRFTINRIPFGIDLDLFSPKSKKDCIEKLNIPDNHKVIAFRNSGLKNDKFKGLSWLLKALEIYEPLEQTTILMLENDKGFEILENKYHVIKTGWIDGTNLAMVLSAADIFLMPSIQESFGMMAVEAMACGTPVIVCADTALPSVIQAPNGGISVSQKDEIAIANAIKLLMEDDALREKLSKQARQIAVENYSFKQYVRKHIELYEKIIKDNSKPTNSIDQNK